MPEETVQATIDLGAKRLLPAHSGRFSMSNHAWDEPYIRLSVQSRGKSFLLATPRIGEHVDLATPGHCFTPWWENPDL